MVNNPKLDLQTARDATTQSETAVAAFGGNIVVAYNDVGKPPYGGLGYGRSTDGGTTFSDLGPIPTTPTSLNLGDPGLVVNRTGVFFASYLAFDSSRPAGFTETVGVSRSVDGGKTWGAMVSPPASGVQRGGFQDKSFIAVDDSRSPNQGNLYLTWTSFPPGLGDVPIVLSRSVDGGATFSSPIQISAQGTTGTGSAPIVGPKGEVYVAWLQYSPTTGVMVAKSVDGGQTFQTPVPVAPVTIPGFSGNGVGYVFFDSFRINAFPRIAVNPVNGEVYIVYASKPSVPADISDVFLVRSTDGGATWSAPRRLNDDETYNDQFFPDLAVNAHGEMRVFWYDRRMDPDNFRIAEFFTRSTDGGRTFEPNRPLVPGDAFPAVGYDRRTFPTYMGDYIDVKVNTTSAGPGNDFLFAWTDFRRFVTTNGGRRPDQDVYFLLQKGSDD
jgi:hypothetical protein